MNITRIALLAGIAIALVLGTTAFFQHEKKQDAAAPMIKQLLEKDHTISLQEAKEMIHARNAGVNGASVKAEAFNRKIFDKILAQKGCAGIRIYYGQRKDGSLALILVGFDVNGKDITKVAIGEAGGECPPFCPYESELLK